MYVKGILRFVEERPARDNYKASRVLTVEEMSPEGKPDFVDVVTEKLVNGYKVGDKIEVYALAKVTKRGGLLVVQP